MAISIVYPPVIHSKGRYIYIYNLMKICKMLRPPSPPLPKLALPPTGFQVGLFWFAPLTWAFFWNYPRGPFSPAGPPVGPFWFALITWAFFQKWRLMATVLLLQRKRKCYANPRRIWPTICFPKRAHALIALKRPRVARAETSGGGLAQWLKVEGLHQSAPSRYVHLDFGSSYRIFISLSASRGRSFVL